MKSIKIPLKTEEHETPYHLCFETLGNDLRMQIVDLLRESPRSVSELATTLRSERSRVSHALQMLSLCTMVGMQKEGKKNIYFVQDTELLESKENVFKQLDKHYTQFCGSCKKK